ncbi:flavohemoglobin expression-modulating QEGLA motif protein [candidate division KSB1 bacterium]
MIKPNNITDRFIKSICTRLSENKRVRRSLPEWGRINIDRQLPFLCVYRKPFNRNDAGTDKLLRGQASYLLASGNKIRQREISKLVLNVVQTLTNEFGAFLILEIWSSPREPNENAIESIPPNPGFRIFVPKSKFPFQSVQTLETSLRNIRVRRMHSNVEVIKGEKCTAPNFQSILQKKALKELNCLTIGLEISPIYRNPATNELYPIILRTFLHKLTYVFLQTFYTFSLNQTTHRPPHYHALGKRSMVRAVWQIDAQLASISSAFDFLLQVTPLNSEKAWSDFKRFRFERTPVFYYRPLSLTPALLKRKLWDVKVERVEDPTIAALFREKQIELDTQISMLGSIGTQKFLYGSLQLYGETSEDLYKLSRTIMEKIPARSRNNKSEGILNALEFAEYAKKEIAYYKNIDKDFSPAVEVRNDITGLMVSHGNLLISSNTRIAKSRAEALLQHEIGTHVLTYYNGKAQPFKQLKSGLAGYDALQEGLAVLAEFIVGGLSRPRLRLLAARVFASRIMVDGATFAETYQALNRDYGFDQRTAFTVTVRTYRGRGLTKDMVYLKGLVSLLDHLKRKGNIETLFVGKIGVNHISIIQELQYRRILKPAPLKPRYLYLPETNRRLEILRKGISVLELIERSYT